MNSSAPNLYTVLQKKNTQLGKLLQKCSPTVSGGGGGREKEGS